MGSSWLCCHEFLYMNISRNLCIFVHVIISVYFHRNYMISCQCLQLRAPSKERYFNKINCEKYFAFAIILAETFSWSS